MFAMAAGATGSPDPLEQAPQQIGPDQAHTSEYPAHCKILPERSVQAEDREDQDLREDRNAVADNHIGDGLDQRHEAGLFHGSNPKRLRACRKLAS